MATKSRRKARQPKRIKLDFDTGTATPYQLPDAVPRDTIVFFESKGRAFRVVFQPPEGSPLDHEITDKTPSGIVIVSPMIPTTYRYAYAIVSADKKDVFFEAHCPSIIVN